MSKMSEMHAMVMTLSEKFGFDPEEAFRALELDAPVAAAAPKAKMVAMLNGQKVKRAQSSYMAYCAGTRERFKAENPDAKVTELAKLMGAAWKALDADGRAEYEALAEADKQRYADEMARAEMVPEQKKKRKAAKAATEAPPAPVLKAAEAEVEPAPTLALPPPAAEAPKAPKAPKAKIPLPYCGETVEANCLAIRKNYGLYTQCTMGRVGGEQLCKTCLKKKEALPYGLLPERATMLDTLGVEPVRYREVMEKMGISREQAEAAAGSLGWTIPETEFEEAPKKKKGRKPKKAKPSAAVESTDEDEPTAQKATGRPKKDNRVVSSAATGDDLITALIQGAEQEATGAADADGAFVPEELEEEAPLEVRVFEHDGVQYLLSTEGAVFDEQTEEEIGRWNEVEQRIERLDGK